MQLICQILLFVSFTYSTSSNNDPSEIIDSNGHETDIIHEIKHVSNKVTKGFHSVRTNLSYKFGKKKSLDESFQIIKQLRRNKTIPEQYKYALVPVSNSPLACLKNKRKSCFINASIQMLFSSKYFVDLITDPVYEDIKVFKVMKTIYIKMGHHNLIEEYRRLWTLLAGLGKKSNKLTDRTSSSIRRMMTRQCMKMLFKQSDTAEFTYQLLSKMNQYQVSSPFEYTYAHDVYCSKHDHTFTVELTCISFINVLPYTPIEKQILTFCEDLITEKEYRNSFNHINTHTCRYEKRRSYFTTIPKMVFIHVERVLYERNATYYKNYIKIPREIRAFNTCYELRSFIMHYGRANGGHFVCVTRTNHGWYYVDDDKHYFIPNIETFTMRNKDVYLLLYESKDNVMRDDEQHSNRSTNIVQ